MNWFQWKQQAQTTKWNVNAYTALWRITQHLSLCSSPHSSASRASFYHIVVTVVCEFWIYYYKYFLHLVLNTQICSINEEKKSWYSKCSFPVHPQRCLCQNAKDLNTQCNWKFSFLSYARWWCSQLLFIVCFQFGLL